MQLTSIRGRARLLLVVSLALNVAVAGLVTVHIARQGGWPYLKHKLGLGPRAFRPRAFQIDRIAVFRDIPRASGEVVFAGDSHVASAPFAEAYTPVRNRGIGGDTTAGLLARLDEITARAPERVFLEVGANDVAQRIEADETLANYTRILRRLRAESPATKVFVLSVPPTCPEMYPHSTDRNAEIHGLNERFAALAAAEGATFVDLAPVLARADGVLRPEFSAPDGVHLNTRGQLEICKALLPHLPAALHADEGGAVGRGPSADPAHGG